MKILQKKSSISVFFLISCFASLVPVNAQAVEWRQKLGQACDGVTTGLNLACDKTCQGLRDGARWAGDKSVAGAKKAGALVYNVKFPLALIAGGAAAIKYHQGRRLAVAIPVAYGARELWNRYWIVDAYKKAKGRSKLLNWDVVLYPTAGAVARNIRDDEESDLAKKEFIQTLERAIIYGDLTIISAVSGEIVQYPRDITWQDVKATVDLELRQLKLSIDYLRSYNFDIKIPAPLDATLYERGWKKEYADAMRRVHVVGNPHEWTAQQDTDLDREMRVVYERPLINMLLRYPFSFSSQHNTVMKKCWQLTKKYNRLEHIGRVISGLSGRVLKVLTKDAATQTD